MAEHTLPDQNTLQVADDILTAYLNHAGSVDSVLFNRFDAGAVSGIQARLRQGGEALNKNDWGDLSLLLGSITLNLRPFPELVQKYPSQRLYQVADDIGDYASSLSVRSIPPKITRIRGKKYGF